MPEHDPIKQGGSGGPGLRCEQWECLLAEALDGTLPASSAAAFEQHGRECAACAEMLEEARRGIAWLEFLAVEPEVPADLAAKILSRTSAAAGSTGAMVGISPASPSPLRFPVWYRTALPIAQRVLESRRLMTAAMAFFSIALTLNLIGVKPSRVHLSDLRPAAVSATLVRQYYSAKEQGVKYYDNLRFVYEMEARVRELRQSTEPAANRQSTPRTQSPSSRNDHSRLPQFRAGRSQARAERSQA